MPTILEGLVGFQRQQEALVEDKQRVQDNALSIQQKMYGIQQQNAENQAIQQFDPTNIDSLQQVAGTLAKAGDAKGSMTVLDTYQNIKDKQALTQTRAVTQRTATLKAAGGILQGMDKSPEDYQRGVMQLLSNGINPMQVGLTGSYETDAAKIPGLTKSTMTSYQQAEIAAKVQTNNRLVETDAFKVQQEQTKNAFEERRVAAQEARLSMEQQQKQDKSKTDILAQNKATTQLSLRKQALATPKPSMIKDAQALLESDPRVADAPDGMKKILALRAANKAAQAMSARINPSDSSTDFTPDDFADEVTKQFEGMVKSGQWKPYVKHTFGKNEGGFEQQVADATKPAPGAPPGQPTAPVKTIDPKTLKPGDFVPTPSGKKLKVIGKKPDGTPMVETDAQGNPVFY